MYQTWGALFEVIHMLLICAYATLRMTSNKAPQDSVPNIAKKSSRGQKMRLPVTKFSLPAKKHVEKAFVSN
jgi:flagellar biogenesis protein FliO